MKEFLKRLLRLLMTPLRKRSRRRNGVLEEHNRIEIPNDILLGLARDMIAEGHTATIIVKGVSMRPFLENERDKVVLDAPLNLKVGDAILAEVSTPFRPERHFVLHRIIRLDGDNIELMGDGNVRGTEQCTTADVAGLVTTYIRPKRVIQADDPRLVRRIRMWRRLLPLRRWLLAIYKSTL